ncbi:MAG: hypothetical protein COW71_07820 [Ignavibacteriales bacterium CG18_big_fil_WC_8_21_14_2_50_31_20]|nr:MAG: hypothetical protein COW71_07820 [Ignavibacteriales bacterium CG18_big_fil_WC_8_21_14_2_50_31_20]
MKNKITLLIFLFIAINSNQFFAQNAWKYAYKISFNAEDSLARPYLCDIDENGRLYVVSSKATGAIPMNAIFYAEADDTLFTKLIDFDANGDSDTLIGNVGAIRGVSTLGSDLFISVSQPYPKYAPTTVAAMYRYIGADTNNVEKYGAYINHSGTGGYGSFIHGLAMSPDTIAFTGVSFGTSFRTYNWSHKFTDVAYTAYIPPYVGAEWNVNNPVEPGGEHTAGVDIIRDIALMAGDDFSTTTSRFFTSRNSLSSDQTTGGIALWQGGIQTEPFGYEPERIVDFDGYLSFSNAWPYGIDVDKDGILWVAGVDSTRRWVKGFELDGVNAIEMYDLPSQTSMDYPDENGAPMAGPCDVVLNIEANKAYVIDMWGKSAFVFTKDPVSVETDNILPQKFELEQNYPNPFNPATKISYTVPKATHVAISVYNMLGQKVASLVNKNISAGNHSVVFDASNLTSGIYLYKLEAINFVTTKKMLLVK